MKDLSAQPTATNSRMTRSEIQEAQHEERKEQHGPQDSRTGTC